MAEKVTLDIDLAQVKADLAAVEQQTRAVGTTSNSTFTAMVKDAQQVSAESRKLNAELAGTSDNIKRADTATGGFSARVRQWVTDVRLGGRSLGEWRDQFRAVVSASGAGEGALTKFGGAFRALSAVIRLSPIGALAAAVLAVVGYFTRFQSGIDKVAQATAAVNAVLDRLIDRATMVGSAVANAFSGNFGAAVDDLRAAVNGLGSDLLNAATSAATLEKQFQQFRDMSRTVDVELARANARLEQANRIADDGTQSYARRRAAAQAAAQQQEAISQKLQDRAIEARQLAEKDLLANTQNGEKRNALAQADIDLTNAVAGAKEKQYQATRQLRDINKEAAEAAKKAAEQAKKEAEARLKALERVTLAATPDGEQRELEQAKRQYDELIALAKEKQEELAKIKARRPLNDAEAQQLAAFSAAETALLEQQLSELADVLAGYADKEIEIEAERQKRREKIAADDRKALEASLNAERDLRLQQLETQKALEARAITVLENSGASERKVQQARTEADLLYQQAQLKIELEFQQQLLAVVDAGDTARIAQVRETIETLKAQIDGVGAELDGLGKNKPGKRVSLAELLGVSPDDADEVQKAVGIAIDSIRQLSEARVEAAKAAVDAAEREQQAAEARVESAEDALNRELELAELGFASNVSRKRAELEEAEKAENLAKQRRERALSDQRKAQRAQIILDTVLQGNNIVTAATDILKGFAKIPIVGGPLGIAAVALMIGAFLKSKAQALAAVRARQGVQGRVGAKGIVVGPTHEDGGVPLEVEGGEFMYQDGRRVAVVNRKATATHFDLLQAINDDDRPQMLQYLLRMTGGIRRDSSVAPGASSSGTSVSREGNKEVENLLRQNNALLRKQIEADANREQWVDNGEHLLRIRAGVVVERRRKQQAL